MEKKINIAELLKDCPQGMELDCLIFDNLVISEIDVEEQDYPIEARLPNGIRKYFTSDGRYELSKYAKCVIFPKGKTTWEGFVPPCKFKDGDVISDSLSTCIFKGEGSIKGTIDYYCGIHTAYFIVKDDKTNPDGHYGDIVDYRLATKEEKEKLFDAIKANGYKWNAETKTMEKLVEPKFKAGSVIIRKKGVRERIQILDVNLEERGYLTSIKGCIIRFEDQDNYELVPNKFDIHTLVPFESRVLVRNVGKWLPAFWGYYAKEYAYPFVVSGGNTFAQCIPYNDDTKHLLGTTDDCADYFKT